MIYLMRHGEDDESYVGGWSDVSLTIEGKEEVLKNGIWIRDNLSIKRIVTSDIKRAKETAQIVSNVLGIEVIENSILREQNKGVLNGKLRNNMTTNEIDSLLNQQVDTIFSNGESLRDLYIRIKNSLDYIMSLDDTLVVTHRGVINMIYYILNNIELDMNKNRFDVSHASIHELDAKTKKIGRIK